MVNTDKLIVELISKGFDRKTLSKELKNNAFKTGIPAIDKQNKDFDLVLRKVFDENVKNEYERADNLLKGSSIDKVEALNIIAEKNNFKEALVTGFNAKYDAIMSAISFMETKDIHLTKENKTFLYVNVINLIDEYNGVDFDDYNEAMDYLMSVGSEEVKNAIKSVTLSHLMGFNTILIGKIDMLDKARLLLEKDLFNNKTLDEEELSM